MSYRNELPKAPARLLSDDVGNAPAQTIHLDALPW